MKRPFKSFKENDSLKQLNDDIVWNQDQKQKQKERLLKTIDHLDTSHERGFKKNLFSTKRNMILRNIMYSGIAVVILSGVFISSAFVSPAMAQVVAKIPYLGQLFSTEPLGDEIVNTVRQKGYNINGASISLQGSKNSIEVHVVGSEAYYNEVKGDIERIVSDIIQKRNYDTYTFKVTREVPDVEEKEELSAEEKKVQNIAEDLGDTLFSSNYSILELGTSMNRDKEGKVHPTVHLQIPNTERRIEEIKGVINKVLTQNDAKGMPIEIQKVDMKKSEQRMRWGDIADDVGEDLIGKEKYHVKTVGSSVHPDPEVSINTSLGHSNDDKAFAKELEKVIKQFLATKKMKKKIKGDSYQIIIYGKGDKKLN
ncbi:DUF4030 domain-containing protein [Priestia megaterium]|uniref:DUF4030 domain-containing protein n=1 Tax=Priestia megaterium TaxID=1404 RepID=UPI00244674D9|nr:DUF4030 domain-containing protein [Priestia megaterium]MEE3897248.1 DUF4030 domain-containing protein [Priestia megaterium]WRQ95692.1 DUF4030 domain-containing protein [Priestia megaterium]